MINHLQKTAVVTGAAGFIGFHLSQALLQRGWRVIGVDCLTDYYDVSLKSRREQILMQSKHYVSVHKNVADTSFLKDLFGEYYPELVLHFAAQAGVRHSINAPHSYIHSNVVGSFELLEAARSYPPKHLMMASTSSVYGASTKVPYNEFEKADEQMSLYAATKKSVENISHSYSHLFDIPITMLRFFTVYGPWGRPDMAIYKFTKAIFDGTPIQIYNNGDMQRDFTYIDDLVCSILQLVDVIPTKCSTVNDQNIEQKSVSTVAPFRIVNLGNSAPVNLLDFIAEIERATGKTTGKILMAMQAGDVKTTWADASLLSLLIDKHSVTSIRNGVHSFVQWYKQYHEIK